MLAEIIDLSITRERAEVNSESHKGIDRSVIFGEVTKICRKKLKNQVTSCISRVCYI